MSPDPPTAPATLPAPLVDALEACSPEALRDVSDYADALAEHRERTARLEEEPETADEGGGTGATDGSDDGPDDDPDDGDESARRDRPSEDLPDDVPAKATTTVKEINDNRYYYWQWREGDQVKSKYKGPVEPSG